jgi:hypothetical protein
MSEQQYSKENRGQIWRSKEKNKDTDRDFQGDININGVEYWLSGWQRKEGANPKAPVISFSVKAKDEVQQQGMQQATQAVEPEKFDDDIPF